MWENSLAVLLGESGWRSNQLSLPHENLFILARGWPGWISLRNPAERMRPEIRNAAIP